MKISLNYKEITSLAEIMAKRSLSLRYNGDNSISFHTEESFILSFSIDWYFTIIDLTDNVLNLKYDTSGWISRKGIKKVLGSQKGVTLGNEEIVVDFKSIMPYKYRNLKVENISISPNGIEAAIMILEFKFL